MSFVPSREGQYDPRVRVDRGESTRTVLGDEIAPGVRKGRSKRPLRAENVGGGSDTFAREIRERRTTLPGKNGRVPSSGELLEDAENFFYKNNQKSEE